jgi:hypothetical protein
MVTIQISVGELIDKLSILQIKLDKIKDENKLKLITREFSLLYNSSIPYFGQSGIYELYKHFLKPVKFIWK